MNKKTLNLLILEDNPDDAELAVNELEKEGFIIKWSIVETEKAFKKALVEKPDLILADYKLPSFSGLSALKIQKTLAPEIPLILISGTIGEEVAVECMKSGAVDYVLKDRLSRLGPVVKRALEEAEAYREREQAKEELQESEERYRNLIENSLDMIQSVVLDGHFIFVNRTWLETLGYTEAELPNLNLFDIIHPESLAHFQELFAKVTRGESVQNIQATFIAKDDREVRVEGNATPRYLGSNIIATQGIFRDITKRKQAEEELKKRLGQLEVYYKATMGREGRVVELKQKVNELLEQLGEKKKYGV